MSVNAISTDDVWRWMGAGWRDLTRAPLLSLTFGVVFVAIGFAITGGLWAAGLSSMIPVAAGCFALIGPLLAVGLYEISRRLEAGERLGFGEVFFVRTASPGQIAFIGFALMFLLMVWVRIAQLLFALFFHGDYVPLPEFASYALTHPDGLALVGVGTVVGAMIAFFVFAVSAMSLPLLMHREADFVTAIATSINAVRTNFGPMLLWAWIVALTTAIGLATVVGLVIVFPLLGHATWHAYRRVVPEAPQTAASGPAPTGEPA
ncbi:MAG: DUF2189 domain-containing protein [Caulobacterales bacterium]|nr:DUF2189 domain-containing protein [Caulobacterales bacterium]